MILKQRIEDDLIVALKAKDELRCSVLRLAKSAIKNAEINAKKEFTDEEVLVVLNKEAKQRKDSIDQFISGGRADLAEKEKEELLIIEEYLPESLSEEKIREIVKLVISDNPDKNFGKIMGQVMKQAGSTADGTLVKRIVEEEIR